LALDAARCEAGCCGGRAYPLLVDAPCLRRAEGSPRHQLSKGPDPRRNLL